MKPLRVSDTYDNQCRIKEAQGPWNNAIASSLALSMSGGGGGVEGDGAFLYELVAKPASGNGRRIGLLIKRPCVHNSRNVSTCYEQCVEFV